MNPTIVSHKTPLFPDFNFRTEYAASLCHLDTYNVMRELALKNLTKWSEKLKSCRSENLTLDCQKSVVELCLFLPENESQNVNLDLLLDECSQSVVFPPNGFFAHAFTTVLALATALSVGVGYCHVKRYGKPSIAKGV